MDQRLLDSLAHASSADLYQLMWVIQHLLESPARTGEIQQRLHVGMQVRYFANRKIALCRVTELRPNKVAVQDLQTNRYWVLPYAAIVLDEDEPGAPPVAKPIAALQVERNHFQVGDTVSFTDKHQNQRVGKVMRRNEKTVTIYCNGDSWRVPWQMLTKIVDI